MGQVCRNPVGFSDLLRQIRVSGGDGDYCSILAIPNSGNDFLLRNAGACEDSPIDLNAVVFGSQLRIAEKTGITKKSCLYTLYESHNVD